MPNYLNSFTFMLRRPVLSSEKHFIIYSKFIPSKSAYKILSNHSIVLNHHFQPLQMNPSQRTQHRSPLIYPQSVIAQGKIKCSPSNF